MKADLEELCDDFGPLKDTCTSLVDEYFDEIWQELIANVKYLVSIQRVQSERSHCVSVRLEQVSWMKRVFSIQRVHIF